MRKAITQEHGMGCAVACTAYVLNSTYQQALNLYKTPQYAWSRGFYCQEIVTALSNAGKLYQYKQIKDTNDSVLNLPDTIVFIEPSSIYPAGHFLVYTLEGCWMNPWINFPLIAPAKSGFQPILPGNPTYAVFPLEKDYFISQ
ncbi:MAG: hypothetical protein BGO76_08755 [Caedibacter sp. 38-128]|nr:hypothetical protein [Holosporales bacterium]OJX07656.1 MAG: hypothetical protein BGO76_08755 [Caedibacter sp. 38-128]